MQLFIILSLSFLANTVSASKLPIAWLPANVARRFKTEPEVSRIIGGTNAVSGQFPFQISLRTTNHFCGGSIIDKRWILTAAHCVQGKSASSLKVRYNTLRYNSGGAFVDVEQVIPHEHFSGSSGENDIAVLKLKSDLVLGQTNAEKVTLPAQGSDTTSGKIHVSGWGVMDPSSTTIPTFLQWVELTILSRASCRSIYGTSTIKDSMICARDAGKDSCSGDSGGPAIQAGLQIGIVSWGKGCASPTYPGVYTRVGSYINWIKSKGVPL